MINNIPREIHFILTNLENITSDIKNISNKRDDFVMGLSNNDFYLNAVDYQKKLSEAEKIEEISKELKLKIPDYSPDLYIDREIYIKSSELNLSSKSVDSEKSLIISISKEKINFILDFAKKNDVFLKGIYPSFLMGDQENLKSLAQKFDFVLVEEVEEEEDEDSQDDDSTIKKTTLVLFHNDEPLNLIERILSEGEIPEYNFYIEEFRELYKRSLISKKVKNIFVSIIILQLVIFLTLSFMKHGVIKKYNSLQISSAQIDSDIKSISKQINLVPNWEARLKKLEEIYSQRSVAANEILYAIKKSIPKGLYIDNLTIKSSTITMKGSTDDIDKIFRFERVLEEMGFADVKHSTINNSGTTGFSFQIDSSIIQQ